MFIFTRLIRITLMIGLLSACTLGENYVRPKLNTPLSFKEQQDWTGADPKDELPRSNWWEIFKDTELNGLVSQIEVSNQNIIAVEAQYRQARAVTNEAEAAYYPTVTAGVTTTRSLPASNTSNTLNYTPNYNTAYRASVSASWVPDIWGSIKRSVEAGNNGILASAGDIGAAKLSAQAQLAQDYFSHRFADAREELLNRTVLAYEKTLQITKNQYSEGIAQRSDILLAESKLKSTKALAVDVGVQRAQYEHAIAILIGKAPSEFSIKPLSEKSVLTVPKIPLGIPSQLLERRPDIAAAERRVAQANANIGVAEAAFYPSLSLSSTLGSQSTNLSKWLTYPSRFWSLGPVALTQPIFNGGLLKAQKAQAIGVYDEKVAVYRQTILTAFQEVEDNLAALRILEQENQLDNEATAAAEKSLEITTNQYKVGTVNYLSVVVAQANALSNEITALSIQNSRLTAAVVLITSLGGGWDYTEQNYTNTKN